MLVSTWPSAVAKNGAEVYNTVAKAISATDTVVSNNYDSQLALIWSVLWNGRMAPNKQVWDWYRSRNLPVVVTEVGGLVRNTTWRLSANGITRNAIFPTQEYNVDRPKKLGLTLKPWHSGDYVLVCGQHGKSQQWQDMPEMGEYYKQTVLNIRKHTDRPIVLRSHPRYREGLFFPIDRSFFNAHNVTWNVPKIMPSTYDDFDIDPVLSHAHCVISHSSNAGIMAIMAGTPAIVSAHSLAFTMGTDDISQVENMPTPDREEWLIDLSHKEWLIEELPQAWANLRINLI